MIEKKGKKVRKKETKRDTVSKRTERHINKEIKEKRKRDLPLPNFCIKMHKGSRKKSSSTSDPTPKRGGGRTTKKKEPFL